MNRCLIPIACALVWCMMAGCTVDTIQAKSGTKKYRKNQASDQNDAVRKRGFKFSVSPPQDLEKARPKNDASPTKVRSSNTVNIARLDSKQVKNLLSRTQAIQVDTSDKTQFSLRKESPPAPRTGQTTQINFPPTKSLNPPNIDSAGPLKITRFSPEGDVPLAPRISLTFSKPMVPLTAHDDTVKKASKIIIDPAIDGAWRWIGTQTIVFQAKPRLPNATKYTVTVPKTMTSLNGHTLPKTQVYRFSTPPPRVLSGGPNYGPQRRDTTMFFRFDQAVDFKEILRRVRVEAQGRDYAVTPTKSLRDIMSRPVELDLTNIQQRRQFQFQTVKKLPVDAQVTVTLKKGVPSLEGTRITQKESTFSFNTYGPLQAQSTHCGYRGRCFPQSSIRVEFTNPIDEERFETDWVSVRPSVPNLRVHTSGYDILISGGFKGNTEYVVTTHALVDVFGQRLKKKYTTRVQVEPSLPQLSIQGRNIVVLDPNSGGKFSVFSTNMDEIFVEIYRVEPTQWNQYRQFMKIARSDLSALPPGKRVFSGAVKTQSRPDELTETNIDLNAAFDGGYGHAILKVLKPPRRWGQRAEYSYKWVQSTQIGLEVIHDRSRMVAWATRLTDGHPLSGVKTELLPASNAKSVTDRGGVAQILKPKSVGGSGIIVATKGRDSAFIPENMWWWNSSSTWHQKTVRNQVRWHHFSDRNLYRPGETVRIKGWLRGMESGPKGGIIRLPQPYKTVSYTVLGSRSNKLKSGELAVNAWGGFNLSFALPKDANLGMARVVFSYPINGTDWMGRNSTERIKVEEFRRPEFEVKTTTSEGPHLLGGQASFSVKAKYFAGGPLPDAPVNWVVRASNGHFTPPNHNEFTFGAWTPWWERASNVPTRTERISGKTNALGRHEIQVNFEDMNPPRAMTMHGEATVTDVNRQRWTSSAHLLVHPAMHYVGLKTQKYFVGRGEPIEVDAIIADIDGKRIAEQPIEMTAHRLAWTQKKGQWRTEPVDKQTCTITSAKVSKRCVFNTTDGGRYRVRALITDPDGRKNQSERIFWVPGGDRPPEQNLKEENLTLIPDKKTYKSGETAKILINSPFFPAQALMTYARQGVLKTMQFPLTSRSHTVEIPIDEGLTPGFQVRIDLVGSSPRLNAKGVADPKLPRRPAFAQGSLRIRIPPASRMLKVEATPLASRLAPGAETSITVRVNDSQNQPVHGADVALVVVDEAILALANYSFKSPIDSFYSGVNAAINALDLRRFVLLANPDQVKPPSPIEVEDAPQKSGRLKKSRSRRVPNMPMAAAKVASEEASVDRFSGGISSAAKSTITVRKNFNALAIFAPSTRTDASGKIVVQVKVPDNLTRYRVIAIAASDLAEFGLGESSITARLPLMVRPSPPRFLNYGDRFEFPIVLQNQTDKPMTARLAMQATNLELTDGAGRIVKIPPNDRIELRLPAQTVSAGTARYQIVAEAGDFTDAQSGDIPVWTPATTEAFATYGVIDDGVAVQGFKMPSQISKDFGKLDITTSSTAVQALTDAFIYLVKYPYGCSEQISSRILGIVALKDVLSAFDADGMPSPQALQVSVSSNLKELAKLQADDGGMPFWRRGHSSWPYLTIHAAHAVARAKGKAFKIPDGMELRFKSYLENIEDRYPSNYSQPTRRMLSSYALYVRALLGDRDISKAKKLFDSAQLSAHSLDGLGWLLSVFAGDKSSRKRVETLRRFLNNRITETAAGAHFVTSITDDAHLTLHSNRRTDGILLDAFISDQPRSDIIPKLVRGLMAHRKQGRWGNTQENAFILLALDRYFRTYEKATPDFVAKVWLGNGFAGQQRFKGRTTDRANIAIPMSYLATVSGVQPITLQKKGPGRLYYRLGLKYAPNNLKLEPADHGFTVTRRYEAIDDPRDVTQNEDGTWIIASGARVRVRLSMVAQTRRYHVALVDPLPAGLEPVNPSLATTGSLDPPPSIRSTAASRRGRYHWWNRTWYEHQNMRDERVEAFTSLLWGGVHEYTYVAQATTPGVFVVPPTKAEEMYHPETFGRSATAYVIVKAKK